MIIKKFDPYESKGRKVFFVGFCFLPFFFLLMFHNCFSSVKRPDSNEWEPWEEVKGLETAPCPSWFLWMG